MHLMVLGLGDRFGRTKIGALMTQKFEPKMWVYMYFM